jgi:adenylate cyclase
MKNIVKYLLSVIIISLSIIGINYKYPDNLKYINDKVLNIFFKSRDNIEIQENVIIIDIDDKSINEVGQWPWSRNTMAELINSLNTLSPAVIGSTIIFSEADRTSPSNFSNKPGVENYDEIFGIAIEDSEVPVVLGYSFLDIEEQRENHIVPYVPAVFKTKDRSKDKISFYNPNSALLNIPTIQDASYSSGFLNSITDENGKVIYMPMLMQYKDQLLPSMALELVRTIYSSRKIYIDWNEKDKNFIEFEDMKIPIDNSALLRVNYFRSYKNIKRVSAVDILTRSFNGYNKNDFENKIVLIGSDASGIALYTPTPFGQISALELQALVVENILSKRYLTVPYWEELFQYTATVVISMVILLSIFFGSVLLNIGIAITCAAIAYFVLLDLFVTNGYIINSTYIIETIILSLVVSIIGYFLKNRADLLNVKGKFASKVSKEVMDDILNNNNKNKDLSSKRKEVTIFFSDIKSFTKITEEINDPSKLTKYINRYMDAMTKNIMLKGGTVDKFMGDAIMAYWNAPGDVENHSDKALCSAIEQVELLKDLNKINIAERLPIIQIRIGLNAGEVFVGEVGGELRNDYTIMGKNVNHTAVLEQAGKYYAASIIMSQSVKDNLKDEYTYMLIDKMQVDGTSDAFNIYQVFEKGLPTKIAKEFIEEFEKAIMFYRKASIDDAILIFRNLQLSENNMNKRLCEIYIKRCENAYDKILNGTFDPIQSIDKSFISS